MGTARYFRTTVTLNEFQKRLNSFPLIGKKHIFLVNQVQMGDSFDFLHEVVLLISRSKVVWSLQGKDSYVEFQNNKNNNKRSRGNRKLPL